jgi:hypothetical protein
MQLSQSCDRRHQLPLYLTAGVDHSQRDLFRFIQVRCNHVLLSSRQLTEVNQKLGWVSDALKGVALHGKFGCNYSLACPEWAKPGYSLTG